MVISANSSATRGWCAIWPSTSRKSSSNCKSSSIWKGLRPECGTRAQSAIEFDCYGDPDPTSAGTGGEAVRWDGSSAVVGMAANPLGAHQIGPHKVDHLADRCAFGHD